MNLVKVGDCCALTGSAPDLTLGLLLRGSSCSSPETDNKAWTDAWTHSCSKPSGSPSAFSRFSNTLQYNKTSINLLCIKASRKISRTYFNACPVQHNSSIFWEWSIKEWWRHHGQQSDMWQCLLVNKTLWQYCILLSARSVLLHNEKWFAEWNIIFQSAIKMILYKAKCEIYFIIYFLCYLRSYLSK